MRKSHKIIIDQEEEYFGKPKEKKFWSELMKY